MPRIGLLALVVVCACALVLPAGASAAFRAKTSVVSASGATRIVVALTSTTRLTARTRPRSVKVKVGRRTYALTRLRGRAGAAVAAGTWRSAAYRGATGAALTRLVGKGVRVVVSSRAGAATLRSTVAAQGGGGGGGGGTVVNPPAPPGPAPPAQRPAEVSGDEGKRQFHEALVGRRLVWTDKPTGYDAAEGWGFCQARVYQRYMSSSVGVQDTLSYAYEVTAGVVHPAQIPQAELLGQILLENGDRYNIAIAYGRQQGAWAKVGSSTDYPFRVSDYVCGSDPI